MEPSPCQHTKASFVSLTDQPRIQTPFCLARFDSPTRMHARLIKQRIEVLPALMHPKSKGRNGQHTTRYAVLVPMHKMPPPTNAPQFIKQS